MKKFRKFLKRNDVIIDFISKIIFGLFSIILLVIANNLVKEQTKVEKEGSAPSFKITKANIKNEGNSAVLVNNGGRVTNLKFEKITEAEITISGIKMKYGITYYNESREKLDSKNKWYHTSNVDNLSYETHLKIEKYLREKYPNEYVNVSLFSTYYKITYLDYENNYKTDYYDINNQKISYSNYRTNEFEYDTDKHMVYTGMVVADITSDKIFNRITDSICNMVDLYLEHEKKAYEGKS